VDPTQRSEKSNQRREEEGAGTEKADTREQKDTRMSREKLFQDPQSLLFTGTLLTEREKKKVGIPREKGDLKPAKRTSEIFTQITTRGRHNSTS